MARRRRSGFTLVELLVVITIIGMLMALLLPAVQSAREAGRRNTCSNNQKNVALAMINFESTRRYFPGYYNKIEANTATAGTNYAYYVSYVVPLFPFLDHQDIYKTYTDATTANGNNGYPFVGYQNLFVCPSNPPATASGPQLAYVVNAGSNSSATGISSSPSSDAKSTVAGQEYISDGICFNLSGYDINGNVVTGVKVSNDYIGSNDGATYTVMVSENNQAQQWTWVTTGNTNNAPTNADGWNAASYTAPPTYTYASIVKATTTFLWDNSATNGKNTSATSPVPVIPSIISLKINGGKNVVPSAAMSPTTWSNVLYTRPSSNHPGGVNMFFADGHFRFIAEDIP